MLSEHVSPALFNERFAGIECGMAACGPQRRGWGDRLRNLRHAFHLGAGIALCTLLHAAPAAGSVFDPESFRLDNGLEVVVVENRRAPVVVQMLWYRVGAADEPPGKSGIAHFLEHLMFKGTEAVPGDGFSRTVARNGGRDNAFTGHDYTAYFQRVASDRLDLVMRLEADRMVNLRLTDADVEIERGVVLEERRSRTDNDPSAQLSERRRAVTWLRHPYRRPVIGWKSEIEALTRADVTAFYRAHYAPSNAVLIVSGDAGVDRVRALAERHFGPIPARDLRSRVRPKDPPQLAAKRLTMRSARVHVPLITVTYRTSRRSSGAAGRAYALQLLAPALGGGPTSRLYRRLVVERGVASSVGAWYSDARLDDGEFSISARPKAGGSIEALEAALRGEIRRLLETGLAEDELERAKRRMLARAVYARDGVAAAPRIIGRALTTGRTIADVEAWPERISGVTVAAANAAARAVLVESRSVTAILLPANPA